MSATDERVLVVPRTVLEVCGVFHGFTPEIERYLPRLLDPGRLSFLPRSIAETDPTRYLPTSPSLVPSPTARCTLAIGTTCPAWRSASHQVTACR